ncbi:MAG: hypothetical protein DCF21_08775 [Leptolyngbya sp.]|uniref:Uncharacterized protein n=1 Tax=Shackletoniella antarctica TaxID=268115 RepID=A0A2W4WDD8_9CYAN|nr:MAG: hypothetical protein DCF17_06745 [Shackletoniella antarctica]PZV17994.1 MAG: hypothetical protein DCF21_08775 [Leptolyngbya sp.]
MVGAALVAGIVIVTAAVGGGGTGENIGWLAGGGDVTTADVVGRGDEKTGRATEVAGRLRVASGLGLWALLLPGAR